MAKKYDWDGFLDLLANGFNFPTPEFEEFMQGRLTGGENWTKKKWARFESKCSEDFLNGAEE